MFLFDNQLITGDNNAAPPPTLKGVITPDDRKDRATGETSRRRGNTREEWRGEDKRRRKESRGEGNETRVREEQEGERERGEGAESVLLDPAHINGLSYSSPLSQPTVGKGATEVFSAAVEDNDTQPSSH